MSLLLLSLVPSRKSGKKDDDIDDGQERGDGFGSGAMLRY